MRTSRQIGQVVAGRFRLESLLGEGGYGTVWAATETELGRRVAIKFLHAAMDDDSIRRFRREGRALARLQHPGCVTLIDIGDDGGPYIVTEYVDGEELDTWADPAPRSRDQLLTVMRLLLEALAYAHGERIVHRDLKPANIFVQTAVDGGLAVKVLDFGIASVVGSKRGSITKTGDVFGTPGYMSPEQLKGFETGPPTDLYACGVIFWELFTGEKLFASDSSIQLMMRHMTEPAPVVDTEPRLAAFIARLLEKEPTARYANAREALSALRQISPSTSPAPVLLAPNTIVPAAQPATQQPPTTGNNKLIALAVVLIGCVVVVVAALVVQQSGGTGESSNESSSNDPPRVVALPTAQPQAEHVGSGCDPAVLVDSSSASPGESVAVGSHVVYLPRSYDIARRHPVMIVQRRVAEPSVDSDIDQLLDGPLGGRRLADDEGWIVVATDAPHVGMIGEIGERFCVDETNVLLATINPTERWQRRKVRRWADQVRGVISVFWPKNRITFSNEVPTVTLFAHPTRPPSISLPPQFQLFRQTDTAICARVPATDGAGCHVYPDLSGEHGSILLQAVGVFDDPQFDIAETDLELLDAAELAASPKLPRGGCGVAPPGPGLQLVKSEHAYEGDIWIYYPDGYDGSRPYPLVVVPGRRADWPREPGPGPARAIFDEYQLPILANDFDAVIVFSPSEMFDSPQAATTWRAACFDSDRVFAIGFPEVDEDQWTKSLAGTLPEDPRWPSWGELPVRAIAVVEGLHEVDGIASTRIQAGYRPRMYEDAIKFFNQQMQVP